VRKVTMRPTEAPRIGYVPSSKAGPARTSTSRPSLFRHPPSPSGDSLQWFAAVGCYSSGVSTNRLHGFGRVILQISQTGPFAALNASRPGMHAELLANTVVEAVGESKRAKEKKSENPGRDAVGAFGASTA
jgi:hypothetical protein